MDDGSSIDKLTNKHRMEGLSHIYQERSGLIKNFKQDFGESLFNEFSQMMFIIYGNAVWKLTRNGEEYCSEFLYAI